MIRLLRALFGWRGPRRDPPAVVKAHRAVEEAREALRVYREVERAEQVARQEREGNGTVH